MPIRPPSENQTGLRALGIKRRRFATLYDAVAGKVGINGFLTREQLESSRYIPQAPEEVLLRGINAPQRMSDNFYNAEEKLRVGDRLPESDLLKAIHSYTSDFYSLVTRDRGKYDFKSLDESALIAMGILMEEATREALGENGDMVLVEPEGLKDGLETKLTKHQIKGKVQPPPTPQYASEESEEDEESPKKKRK